MRWFLLLMVVGVFGFVGFQGLSFPKPLFQIQEVFVNWSTQPDQGPVENLVREKILRELQSVKGEWIWKIEPEVMLEQIKKNSWVDQISIHRQWPNKILVNLRLKIFRAVAINKKGEIFPIASDGDLLPKIPGGEDLKKVVFRGNEVLQKKEVRLKALEVLSSLPDRGDLQEDQVSVVEFDSKYGFSLFLKNRDVQIKLGEERWKVKTARAQQVLDYLISRQLDARVIDANLSKKVLVRLRKDP